jgi:hypothetical protein
MNSTWRTTVVGLLLIGFAVARIAFKNEAMFDGETIGLVTGGCSLILGSDKLLGVK